jgi:hypothetical protein
LLLFQRGREKERERERSMMRENHGLAASGMTHTGDQACNPVMCPWLESKPGPFNLQANTLSTEPNQPGPELSYLKFSWFSHLNFTCKLNPPPPFLPCNLIYSHVLKIRVCTPFGGIVWLTKQACVHFNFYGRKCKWNLAVFTTWTFMALFR